MARSLSKDEPVRRMEGSAAQSILASYKAEVEKALSETYGSQGWIAAAVHETIGAGGKRLRPLVALLVCEAISGDRTPAMPVALAYELAHSASLVQDDIIDESSIRHAAPTAHKRYGLARAILLSDSMIFEIFTQLSRYGEKGMSRERIAQLLFLLGRAARLAGEGELLEVVLSRRGDIKEEEYLEVIKGKTGALFAAAAASGAVAATADQSLVDKMYDFGLALGTAFQIGDDVLDLLGDVQVTGKPAFKDIQNNAGNIVLVHTLSHANALQKNVINSLLFKKWFTALESEKLLQLLTELGSFNYASSLLNAEIAKCKSVLNLLPASAAKDALLELVLTVEVRRE